MDDPTEVCMAGALARRGVPRDDLPWVEPPDEPLDAEFLALIEGYVENERPRMLRLLTSLSDKQAVIFHSRQEADAYLQTIT